MEKQLNKVQLSGILDEDPKIKKNNGHKRAELVLANRRVYKTADGKEATKVERHKVIAWSPYAEMCEDHICKGSKVYIDGSLSSSSYGDKEGNKRYTTEIITKTLFLIGPTKHGWPHTRRFN